MSYKLLAFYTIRKGRFDFALLPAIFVSLMLAACASTQQDAAPVVDRSTPLPEGTVETLPAASAPEASLQQRKTYVVQRGDTLYAIALNHGVNQKDVAEWNNIQDPASIHIGQQLYLSPPSEQAQPSLFSISEPGPQSKAVTTPGAVPPQEGKPGVNTDKLKSEPRAFKVPYSEQALAQLRGMGSTPTVIPVIAKVNLAPEKSSETLAAAPSPAEVVRTDDGVGWIWPTKGKLLDGFSEATKGIDIAGKPGQAVTAAAAGKVVYSGAGLRGYGKLIIIKHNNTYLSAYAHNDKILVKEGQTVTKGQKIAEMGSTDTDLVKLHFEIRKNGKPVDPLKHLPGAPG
jgi:lipoprotein NlpD